MDRFRRQLDRTQRLASWMAAAMELKLSYEEDGEPLPEPLTLVFPPSGVDGGEGKVTIHPPRPPVTPPPGFGEGWIWVAATEAVTTTQVLAAMRKHDSAITPRELTMFLRNLVSDVSAGSIANIGTRLGDSTMIERTDEGWRLTPTTRERSPILEAGYIWGPPAHFDKQDIAAFRRYALAYVLRKQPDGLQIVQLVRFLEESCRWFPKEIPVSKDLVKVDLQVLEKEGRVRRCMGNANKWEAA